MHGGHMHRRERGVNAFSGRVFWARFLGAFSGPPHGNRLNTETENRLIRFRFGLITRCPEENCVVPSEGKLNSPQSHRAHRGERPDKYR